MLRCFPFRVESGIVIGVGRIVKPRQINALCSLWSVKPCVTSSEVWAGRVFSRSAICRARVITPPYFACIVPEIRVPAGSGRRIENDLAAHRSQATRHSIRPHRPGSSIYRRDPQDDRSGFDQPRQGCRRCSFHCRKEVRFGLPPHRLCSRISSLIRGSESVQRVLAYLMSWTTLSSFCAETDSARGHCHGKVFEDATQAQDSIISRDFSHNVMRPKSMIPNTRSSIRTEGTVPSDTAAPHFQNARYMFSYNAWSRSEGLGLPSGPKEKSPSSVFAGRPLHEPSVFPLAVICVQTHPLRNSPSRHLSRPLNGEEHSLSRAPWKAMPPFHF